MLVTLGFTMVALFMVLIMTKRLTPVVALILVPLAFAVIAGTGVGVGDAVMEQVGKFAPTAALLFFAIVYFGLMIDVGLFDPLIRLNPADLRELPRQGRHRHGRADLARLPRRDGSTTFIITVSAMLPLYLRLGLSPVVLTVVANLAAGVMNIIPWGGPTVRAATALGVSPSELFNPMVRACSPASRPSSSWPGRWACPRSAAWRRRGASSASRRWNSSRCANPPSPAVVPVRARPTARRVRPAAQPSAATTTGMTSGCARPRPSHAAPRLIWFNGALTVALLVLLGMDVMPLPFLFMVAAASRCW